MFLENLTDIAAERAVLSGIFQYGSDAYVDIADIVNADTFTDMFNQCLYKTYEYLLKDEGKAQIDLASIMVAADTIGVSKEINHEENRSLLRAVTNFPIEIKNVRKMAAKVRKLQIARLLQNQLDAAKSEVSNVTGDETISHILGLVEKPIFDFTSLLNDAGTNGPENMGDGAEEYVKFLEENERDMAGISTGYAKHDMAIGGGLRKGTVNIIASRAKKGKAEPLDAIVMTTKGPKKMGEIKNGDMVCDNKGGYSFVDSIHPQGKLQTYKILFSDGDSVIASGEHLWKIKYNRKNKYYLKTTEEIIKSGLIDGKRPKWQIELPSPALFEKNNLPIPPYILGLLLGDGSFRNCVSFTNIDEQLINEIKKYAEKTGHRIYKRNEEDIDYFLYNKQYGKLSYIKAILMSLKLFNKTSKEKFIPEIYKTSSIDDRIDLIRGLMDTDGSIGEDGQIEYCTSSLKLAEDFKFLINSIGGITTIRKRKTSCNNKQFVSYRLLIKINNIKLFRLQRKLNRYKIRKKATIKRNIISIIPDKIVDCQCIKLSSEDGLYLTDNFVVTHNTQLVDNMATFISGKLNVPCLNLDTEMTKEDHWNRILANLSGVKVDDIELGKFKKPEDRKKVYDAARYLKSIPYSYISIAGQPFEETLALMRRWVVKTVGLNDDGTAKPCVIFFDYLKLMSSEGLSKNMQETQLLGFLMTGLHNFMIRYKIPCQAFAQLNRDGINKEDTDTIGGSDRFLWFCSSLCIYKEKSAEEMAEDATLGESNYNRKMVYLASRHGRGLEDGDYLNMIFDGSLGRITEGKTQNELRASEQTESSGFSINDESVVF